MKVQQSSQLINPFGGIQFVIKHIKDQGIDKFIDEQMGSRGAKKEYSISDDLLAIHYSHLCGGSCIEDTNTLNEHMGFHPGLSLPSADTLLRIMQELKTENTLVKNGDVIHRFNHHEKFNNLLQRLAMKTRMIVADAENILDYDNVIIEHEKSDAARTYILSSPRRSISSLSTAVKSSSARLQLNRSSVLIRGIASCKDRAMLYWII